MRVFISNVDQYIGKNLCADLRVIYDTQSLIFGTVTNPNAPVPASVKRVVAREDPRQLLKTLLTCSLIVFDLATADLEELNLLLKVMKITKIPHKIVIVVISSAMVWARTLTASEQLDPDAVPPGEEEEGGEMPEVMPTVLTGEDYQKRIPAKEYTRWKTAETLALSLNAKENLTAYIVCSGMLYGCGESSLLDSMKASWLQLHTATVISAVKAAKRGWPDHDKARLQGGGNYVPTVHVRDLARLVSTLSLGEAQEQYLLCVDTSKAQQRDLAQTIVDKVGESFPLPVVEAGDYSSPLADAETQSPDYPHYMGELDLRMEPCSLMADPGFAWYAKDGLYNKEATDASAANLEVVAAEFCRWQNLRPVKILLAGPPIAGKTTTAAGLAEYYGTLHIKMADVIDEGRKRVQSQVAASAESGEEVDEETRQIFEVFFPTADEDGNTPPPTRLTDQLEAALVRPWLRKNICKYKGYVLDGYPRNYQSMTELLMQPKKGAEGEADPDAEPELELAEDICPEFVVVVDPPDETLHGRIYALDQAKVDAERDEQLGDQLYTEAGFEARLAAYKASNKTPGVPPLAQFFQERDLKVMELTGTTYAENDTEEQTFDAIRLFVEQEGRPWNYMVSERELAGESFARVEASQRQMEEQARAEADKVRVAERKVREERRREEEERTEQLVAAEQDLLEGAALPLQRYLQSNVVPILTAGLLETCSFMPEDPVEYMAEYLFEHANDMEVQPLLTS
jgi:adenylate kinase